MSLQADADKVQRYRIALSGIRDTYKECNAHPGNEPHLIKRCKRCRASANLNRATEELRKFIEIVSPRDFGL